jgi:hypothetical protein
MVSLQLAASPESASKPIVMVVNAMIVTSIKLVEEKPRMDRVPAGAVTTSMQVTACEYGDNPGSGLESIACARKGWQGFGIYGEIIYLSTVIRFADVTGHIEFS